jgi:hypothetical protein
MIYEAIDEMHAELARLSAINVDLLRALKAMVAFPSDPKHIEWATFAIAKAEGRE